MKRVFKPYEIEPPFDAAQVLVRELLSKQLALLSTSPTLVVDKQPTAARSPVSVVAAMVDVKHPVPEEWAD